MNVRADRGFALQQYERSVASLESMLPERVLARFELLKRRDARLMRLENKHSAHAQTDTPALEARHPRTGPVKACKATLPAPPVPSLKDRSLKETGKEQMSTKRMISRYLDRGNPGSYTWGMRQSGKNSESQGSLNRDSSKPAVSGKTSKPILKNSRDRSFRSNKTVTFEDQQDQTEATDGSKQSFLVDSSAVLR